MYTRVNEIEPSQYIKYFQLTSDENWALTFLILLPLNVDNQFGESPQKWPRRKQRYIALVVVYVQDRQDMGWVQIICSSICRVVYSNEPEPTKLALP